MYSNNNAYLDNLDTKKYTTCFSEGPFHYFAGTVTLDFNQFWEEQIPCMIINLSVPFWRHGVRKISNDVVEINYSGA